MADVCEKCGLPLDENGVCAECSAVKDDTPSNDVWARPGSVPAPKKSETAEKTKPVENTETEAPTDDVTPKLARSQIGTAEQRAAYFNAIAGVEEEEVDEQFYVSETGLFDVPFNDTKENLGYNFPKFRHCLSRKTKKKLKISSILVASIAAVTALAVAFSGQLNLNFSFFNKVSEVPVLYSNDKSIYMTTSRGGISTDIYYTDRRTTVSDTILDGEVKRLSFSPDYSRMLTVEKYDSSDGIYTLYERETYADSWREAESNGALADSGICSKYSYICGNDAIVYLKRVGDTNELCVYSFSNGAVKKVASDVTSFSILNNNTVLYIQEDTLYTLTYNNHTDFSSEIFKKNVVEVVTAYDYGYSDSENCFYITKNENSIIDSNRNEIFYNSGELHYVADGKDTLYDTDVECIVMPCFEKGTAYYLKSRAFSLAVSDFIEDDCEKEDAKYVESVGYYNIDMAETSVSDLMKFLRHNLRNIKYGNQSFSVFSLGVISEIATDLWHFDGNKKTEISKSVTKIIETDCDAGVLVYLSEATSVEKMKFSEVAQPYVQSFSSLTIYCGDFLYGSMTNKAFSVCTGTKSAVLDASYVRQAECTDDKSMMYFIDTEKEMTETGILKSISLSELSACEIVVNEIKSFEVIGNKSFAYSTDDSFFCNGEKIGQKVSAHQAANNGQKVVFLADYDTYLGTGTLKAISDNNVETLCSDIHDFAVYNDEVLAYIGDYNKAEKTGNLYLASNIKAGKATANKAQSLVRY